MALCARVWLRWARGQWRGISTSAADPTLLRGTCKCRLWCGLVGGSIRKLSWGCIKDRQQPPLASHRLASLLVLRPGHFCVPVQRFIAFTLCTHAEYGPGRMQPEVVPFQLSPEQVSWARKGVHQITTGSCQHACCLILPNMPAVCHPAAHSRLTRNSPALRDPPHPSPLVTSRPSKSS